MENQSAPKHMAIIMDGNGRWALSKGLPRNLGHKKGAEIVPEIVEFAMEQGVKYITLFVFSSENWARPKEEIDYLIDLMREYTNSQLKELSKKNVRIKVMGEIAKLPKDLQEKIGETEEISKDKDGITVSLAVSYGGRDDIIHASKQIAKKIKNGELDIDDINQDTFQKGMYSNDLPDIDVLIRTGGEYRLSNFLLWHSAYSELFFVDKYWPDFQKEDIKAIISEYKNRNRRFGKV